MDEYPRVSVVIPVYNGAKYLKEAIESVFAQTYSNIEVIVINDGSTDDGATEKVALSFGDKIRYISKENGGVGSALNRGLQEMTGEYFSWLSHDDVYVPDKVSRQVALIQRESKNTILYSDYEYIDSESKQLGIRRIRHIEPGKFIYNLFITDPLNGCTALIPKACFDATGLFNGRLRTTQDYEMWFRMARTCRFVHVPEVFLKSRLHPEQGSKSMDLHVAECNDLYVWALTEFTEHEIFGNDGRTTFSHYLELSALLTGKHKREAAGYAYKIARNHLAEANLFDILHDYGLFVFHRITRHKSKVFKLVSIAKRVFFVNNQPSHPL